MGQKQQNFSMKILLDLKKFILPNSCELSGEKFIKIDIPSFHGI